MFDAALASGLWSCVFTLSSCGSSFFSRWHLPLGLLFALFAFWLLFVGLFALGPFGLSLFLVWSFPFSGASFGSVFAVFFSALSSVGAAFPFDSFCFFVAFVGGGCLWLWCFCLCEAVFDGSCRFLSSVFGLFALLLCAYLGPLLLTCPAFRVLVLCCLPIWVCSLSLLFFGIVSRICCLVCGGVVCSSFWASLFVVVMFGLISWFFCCGSSLGAVS